MGEFDFQTLVQLAKNDPVTFYALRSKHIANECNNAGCDTEELCKTQEEIDLIRASTVNPSLCLYGINEMMISNLCALQDALEYFDSIVTST